MRTIIIGCCIVIDYQCRWQASAHSDTARRLLSKRQSEFDRVYLDYAGRHPHEGHDNDRSLQQQHLSNDTSASVYYEPIRFQFDTQAIEARRGIGLDDEIDFILSTVLPTVADNWSRHLYVVPNLASITINTTTCPGIFQGRQEGDFQATTMFDVDLAIVVAAYDELLYDDGITMKLCGQDSSTLALALPCALDQLDRPAIGFINFCLNKTSTAGSGTMTDDLQQQFGSYLNTTFRDDDIKNNVIEVATHELGHALGFTSDMYKYYRDEYGIPRTPRPFQYSRMSCPNGENVTQIFPSENTVQLLSSTGGRLSHHIVTPRVAQVVRNLFNCPSLRGARLDDSPTDCLSSHFHERLFYNELMGPQYASASQNILSPLTLALMEDTGFYKVDYRGAPISAYGLGAGCDFVYGECVVNDSIPDYGISSFCNTSMEFTIFGNLELKSLNSATCDPSHKSWVTCDLYNSSTVPYIFNTTINKIVYWSAQELFTPNDKADSCPMLAVGLGRDCTLYDPTYEAHYEGEVTGTESRCIRTSAAWSSEPYNRPACFEVICDSSLAQVQLRIGEQLLSCDWDGQTIAVGGDSPYSIVCPDRSAVCPQLFSCPSHCSGRGVCLFNATLPYCQCFDGALRNPACRQPILRTPAVSPSASQQPINQPMATLTPSLTKLETYIPTRSTAASAESPLSSSVARFGLMTVLGVLGIATAIAVLP
ncbi:hypothetical protein MPSEU_000095600 [Mayamaea pseudoterrestris]|nr:hypothetical protein MPSEU_000095600 [Mayamaea pseudoterrestris]